jgi:hypothetical protein
MGEETVIRINFPDTDPRSAHDYADSLLSDLKQDPDLHRILNIDGSRVVRNDREAQDFGATLIVALGTPAVILLAKAIKSWAERTGQTTIELDGVRIENIRSRDAASILRALGR